MIKLNYLNAMAEVLHYLKGIRQEDINKIPQRFMLFLQENASKDYVCDFDYTKPLKELKLLDETKGFIGMICLNYWCETEDKKREFINKLNANEKIHQEELCEKYNLDNIFERENVDKKHKL